MDKMQLSYKMSSHEVPWILENVQRLKKAAGKFTGKYLLRATKYGDKKYFSSKLLITGKVSKEM